LDFNPILAMPNPILPDKDLLHILAVDAVNVERCIISKQILENSLNKFTSTLQLMKIDQLLTMHLQILLALQEEKVAPVFGEYMLEQINKKLDILRNQSKG